jgi:phosphotransferase system HPr (HPr) family protein
MTTRDEVRLTDAPFVEGLIAAVVLANAGASLDEVDREARAAMAAKQSQLAGHGQAPTTDLDADRTESSAVGTTTSPNVESAPPAEVSAEAPLINPDGLHTRPAAAIVQALATMDAQVTITDITSGTGPVAAHSLIGIMSLGATKDHVVKFSATGSAAQSAIETLVAMTADGFGELAN